MKHVKMDLKVCEGCGGLWVRNEEEPGVYCRHCSVTLAEFPAPRVKREAGVRKRLEGIAMPQFGLTPQLSQMGGAR